MPDKSVADWERIAQCVCERDPYRHLRSIHNCGSFYDYARPWITHCSIQRQDIYRTAENVNIWRQAYRKPVVLDEIAYEGDIPYGWGNLTGEEMLRRFWECALRGGYPGHGETLLNKENRLWWSHGGALRGESWKRFGFLLEMMRRMPGGWIKPSEREGYDEICAVPEDWSLRRNNVEACYLYYYSFMRPAFRNFHIDDTTRFRVSVLDTWEATERDLGVMSGAFRVDLPAKPYMAIMLTRVD